jgi:type I restriction enzyme, S subunit
MNTFVSIGSVVSVNPPIPQTLKNEPNILVSFLSMSAISETGKILAPEEYQIDAVIKGYRYFERGDVLLAKITPCMENGKAVFVDLIPHKIGFGSTEFHVLRPSSEIDGRYLFYMIWNPMFRYIAKRNMTGTAGQRRVPADFIKRFQIPFPPLEEQKRIAAILDKADAIRRSRKKAIALTEELLRSTFLNMFGDPVTNPKGWETDLLGNAGFLNRGKSKHRPRNDPSLLNGKYPLIQTGDIANCKGIIETYVQTYSEKGLAQSKMWDTGTLCITIAANIAKTGILGFDACFPDSVVGFQPNEKTTNEYIQGWLQFLQPILEDRAPQSAQKNINLEILRKLDLPVPPIELQQQFSAFTQMARAFTKKIEANEGFLNNLFNSLLQKAFRGEL